MCTPEHIFAEIMFFVTLAPLCSDSSTFEGLGAQVGATLGPKSYQKGVRTAQSGLAQGRWSGQDSKAEPVG